MAAIQGLPDVARVGIWGDIGGFSIGISSCRGVPAVYSLLIATVLVTVVAVLVVVCVVTACARVRAVHLRVVSMVAYAKSNSMHAWFLVGMGILIGGLATRSWARVLSLFASITP